MFPRSILISLILVNSLAGADKDTYNPILADQLPDLELGLTTNMQKSPDHVIIPMGSQTRSRTRSDSSGQRGISMTRRPSNGSSRSTKIPREMRKALSQLPQDSQERLTDLFLRQPTSSTTGAPQTSVSEELRSLKEVMADSVKLQGENARLQEQRLTETINATKQAKKIALIGAAFTAVYGTASFVIDNLPTIKAWTGW